MLIRPSPKGPNPLPAGTEGTTTAAEKTLRTRAQGALDFFRPAARAAKAAELPVDLSQPFDAHAESAMLQGALRGDQNHWSKVVDRLPSQYAGKEERLKVFTAIQDAARDLSPENADELTVRLYNSLVEMRGGMSASVRRYIANLKAPLERGPVVHGFVGEICVPEGETHGTFKHLENLFPMLQGRPDPMVKGARWRRAVADRLFDNRLGAKLGTGPRADEGLGFRRLMLTPFHSEDQADGGYSQIDPTVVDARYGGNAEHEGLLHKAIRRGVEIISDRIPNHNSYLHERSIALRGGDLSRLGEHVNWSGAAKVGETSIDGQKWNVILHAGGDSGAVSRAWAIFPDSNPDSLVRLRIPLLGKYREEAELKQVMPHFALDEKAQKEVQAVFAAERPTAAELASDRKIVLSDGAQKKLAGISSRNDARVLAGLMKKVATENEAFVDVDLFMSFMGGIQYDKELAHPSVFQEELDAHGIKGRAGESGVREDAVIHADKAPGTKLLNEARVGAFMRLMNLYTEMLVPGRVMVPEAFLPQAEIESKFLQPSMTLAGKVHGTMGNLAISFRGAMMNTQACLTGDVTGYLDHVKATTRAQDALGHFLEYPVRLHDESLLDLPHLEELVADGKLVDPFVAVDAAEAKLTQRGQTLGVDEALTLLRKELEKPELVNFANRAAGDDPAEVLGKSPEKIAQAIALTYAGAAIPAVYYRLLAGDGNDIDFALARMKGRVDAQVASGEPINFRKAFDARDLGRGPVSAQRWQQLLDEKYLPLVTVRGLNRLWQKSAAIRSRRPEVMANADRSIAVFARRASTENGFFSGRPALAKSFAWLQRQQGVLQVFNAAEEARTVRIPRADVERALGWKLGADASGKRFTDALASAMSGRTVRVDVREDGDDLTFELPAHGQIFLSRRSL